MISKLIILCAAALTTVLADETVDLVTYSGKDKRYVFFFFLFFFLQTDHTPHTHITARHGPGKC